MLRSKSTLSSCAPLGNAASSWASERGLGCTLVLCVCVCVYELCSHLNPIALFLSGNEAIDSCRPLTLSYVHTQVHEMWLTAVSKCHHQTQALCKY